MKKILNIFVLAIATFFAVACGCNNTKTVNTEEQIDTTEVVVDTTAIEEVAE